MVASMALYGVLGDIHGNREALVATLAALEDHRPERLLCIGDIIGYNADSDACAAILRERGVVSIAGNHDLIGINRLGFERCSNKAMHALKRTRRLLQSDTVEYLRSLPRTILIEDSVVLVHGGVRDVQQYMTTPLHIEENVRYLRADFPGRHVCFYGHMHEQKIFEVADDGSVRDLLADGVVKLRSDREYFVNPGSLDASRKQAPKFAEFALFDSGPMTVEFFRVPYDDMLTEAKAAGAGYRIGPWRDRFYALQRKVPGFR
jgi:predicted phosphodiesterase